MKNVLLSSPTESLLSNLTTTLTDKGFSCETAASGKETQLKIYQKQFFAVVLDVDTIKHTSLEVLKYLKLNHYSLVVVLYFCSKERFQALGLTEASLFKMGVNRIFIGPNSVTDIPRFFLEMDTEKWKGLKASTEPEETARPSEGPESIADAKLTRIKLSEFQSGTRAVFDHYVRLSENRYVKILHQGQGLQPARILKYQSEGLEYIYFLTKDRAVYINYMNEVAAKLSQAPNVSQAVSCVSNISSKLIDEIYTSGIQPQLLEEGLDLCRNIQQIIKKEPNLNKLLDEYKELDPNAHSHLFLITFFSAVICKNLDWAGAKTKEAIGLASLLLDIGLLKLPVALRDKKPEKMTAAELVLYNQHPANGYEMLQKYSSVNEQVRQIVYQHHETVNGTGFPNQLTSIKIYPLAKIVSFADMYSKELIEQKVTPIVGIRTLLKDKEKLINYDAAVIKAMVFGLSVQGK
ncbi:MAG TPA: HD domain-containing phosphohydrolase [Bacteriovoracaceae bacterium]|nr:HD domain-containing phosphohydrolase [Bacteriovoracaceae bacterium]